MQGVSISRLQINDVDIQRRFVGARPTSCLQKVLPSQGETCSTFFQGNGILPAQRRNVLDCREWFHFTGSSGGAPLFFTSTASSLAGCGRLAFRPTTWKSSGRS
jgi:hypothetical protein